MLCSDCGASHGGKSYLGDACIGCAHDRAGLRSAALGPPPAGRATEKRGLSSRTWSSSSAAPSGADQNECQNKSDNECQNESE
eukprot:7064586-Prymnesium_polylepis.1